MSDCHRPRSKPSVLPNGQIQTIEGNSSDRVSERMRPTRRRGWICPNELDSLSNLPYGRSQAEAIGFSRYGTRGYTTLGAAIVHGPGGEAKTPAGLDEKPVQVVIVDDYPLARQALPALLAANGIVVSGTASSVHDVGEIVDRHHPSVALVGVTFA